MQQPKSICLYKDKVKSTSTNVSRSSSAFFHLAKKNMIEGISDTLLFLNRADLENKHFCTLIKREENLSGRFRSALTELFE